MINEGLKSRHRPVRNAPDTTSSQTPDATSSKAPETTSSEAPETTSSQAPETTSSQTPNTTQASEATSSSQNTRTPLSEFKKCMQTCFRIRSLNPICGDDLHTYENWGELNCALECGKSKLIFNTIFIVTDSILINNQNGFFSAFECIIHHTRIS